MSCDAIKAQIQKFDKANDFNIDLYQNLKSQYNQLPSPFTTSGRPLAEAVRAAAALETEFKKLSKLKFLFIQTIYKKSDTTKPVLKAEITGCCLDRHSGRPVQIENSILAAL